MKKESRGKYLFKNTAIFSLGNLGPRFLSLILVPLYTGALTTGEYGVIDLITTVCAILVPVITMNIGEAIMRFSLDKNADQKNIMKIGWVYLFICFILGVIACPALRLFNSTRDYALFISIYSISMGAFQISTCNLRGKELLLAYSVASILNAGLAFGFNVLFLLVFKLGVKGYFSAYILSNILSSGFALIKGNAFDSLKSKLDHVLMNSMIKYSVFLIPTSLMWWITNSSDRIMVTLFNGADANGIYAISYKIPTLISSLSSIFIQAWSYSAIKEHEKKDEEKYSNIIYRNLFSTMLLLISFLTLIMKPFLRIYVNQSYYTAWKYTPFLMVGSIFMTLATFLSTSYTVHKDSRAFLISGSVGAVLNIILNWILIPIIGIYGAAIATFVSYVSVFAFRAFHVQKYIRIKPFDFQNIIGLLIVIFMNITIYGDGIYATFLLGAEFLVLLVFYRKFIIEFVVTIKKTILK